MEARARLWGRGKQAAVMLPCQEGRVLMQLRDQKPGIAFPGHWGFFSGSLEPGETPLMAARRELGEELGLVVDRLCYLGLDLMQAGEEVALHAFACALATRPDQLRLAEGLDLGLFAPEDLRAGRLYSARTGRAYPVVDHPYIRYTVRRALASSLGRAGN